MLALYRKYRPQRFQDIFGQDHIKHTLRQEVVLKRLAHAYIFTGPRGTGKTSTARILAAAANCLKQKDGEPCTACDHCQAIKSGTYIDLIEIDAASQTGVDNVRENVIEHARFVPQRGAYKFFIIDEAHMLSPAAWNALLKTLEEPPLHAIFVLATTEAKKIPDTIVSRCQYFRFKPLAHDIIKERIRFIAKEESIALDDRSVDEIAARSGGYARDAETLLGTVCSLGLKKITWDAIAHLFDQSPLEDIERLADALLKGSGKDALHVVQQLRDDGITSDTILSDLLDLYRALLYFLMTEEIHPLFMKKHGTKAEACVKNLLQRHRPLPDTINRCFQSIAACQERVRTVSADIALEMALADLCISAGTKHGTSDAGTADHEGLAAAKPKTSAAPPAEAQEPPAEKPTRSAIKKTKKDGAQENQQTNVKHEAKVKEAALIALTQVQDAWNELVIAMRVKSGTLGLILGFAKLLSIEPGNTLRLGFTYRLHFEQCGQDKNRRLLEQGLAEKFSAPFLIEPILLASEPAAESASPASNDSLLHNVIDFFGGKVVGS